MKADATKHEYLQVDLATQIGPNPVRFCRSLARYCFREFTRNRMVSVWYHLRGSSPQPHRDRTTALDPVPMPE